MRHWMKIAAFQARRDGRYNVIDDTLVWQQGLAFIIVAVIIENLYVTDLLDFFLWWFRLSIDDQTHVE